jgi:hypothetical protein
MRQVVPVLLVVLGLGIPSRPAVAHGPLYRNEILFAVGTMPASATSKGLTLYGSYTLRFTRHIGWEVLGGMWFFSSRRDAGISLEDELSNNYDVQPTAECTLEALINSNLIFTPLRGDLLVLGDVEIGGEVFLNLGYAMGSFSNDRSASGLDAGLGVRLRLGHHTSVRLDLREYLFFHEGSHEHNFHLSVGLGLGF